VIFGVIEVDTFKDILELVVVLKVTRNIRPALKYDLIKNFKTKNFGSLIVKLVEDRSI
jgi:hypothetical protein